MTNSVRVWSVTRETMPTVAPRLREILIDSVEHGASVGFLMPLGMAEADAYWERIAQAVAAGRFVLLVAALDGLVLGTVQLDMHTMPNQPHRAEIHKLLVHSSARRRGIGEALMLHAERLARDAGRWLLTLDTATPEAARLYERMGWQRAGSIPSFALNPDRSLTSTTFYWKQLADHSPG